MSTTYVDEVEEATQQERVRCLAAVDAEPELPGPMPEEMWRAVKDDRDAMTEALRVVVRQSKDGIRQRISGNVAPTPAGTPSLHPCFDAFVGFIRQQIEDGRMDAEGMAERLVRYALTPPEQMAAEIEERMAMTGQ